MKKSWIILGSVLFIIMVGIGYNVYQNDSKKANVLKTKEQQLTILKEYPEVNAALLPADDPKAGMYPIPGLFEGESIALKTGEKSLCHDLTPQGIAMSADKIYISEYCHLHEHHSVVQVIDKKTKKWEKTIVVPGEPHLGGIVYRKEAQQLWLATETNKKASLSLLLTDTLADYDLAEKSQPIRYDMTIPIGDIPKASLLAYLDPFLVVGYFSNKKEGKLAMFPFDTKGDLVSVVTQTQTFDNLGTVDDLNSEDTTHILKKIQGISYWKNYMFMSQSFGNRDSKLYVFDLQDTKGGFNPESAKLVLDFPPYLEQINTDGDSLFAMFESGAKAYRHHTNKNIEYAIQLDIKTLLGNLKIKE